MTKSLPLAVQAVVGGESSRVPPESEAQFMQVVVDLARSLRWLVYHTADSRRSAAGFPDLIMVRHDRIIASEIKRQDGRLTSGQNLWLAGLDAAGVEVYVWRPSDKQRIAEILR